MHARVSTGELIVSGQDRLDVRAGERLRAGVAGGRVAIGVVGGDGEVIGSSGRNGRGITGHDKGRR